MDSDVKHKNTETGCPDGEQSLHTDFNKKGFESSVRTSLCIEHELDTLSISNDPANMARNNKSALEIIWC